MENHLQLIRVHLGIQGFYYSLKYGPQYPRFLTSKELSSMISVNSDSFHTFAAIFEAQ